MINSYPILFFCPSNLLVRFSIYTWRLQSNIENKESIESFQRPTVPHPLKEKHCNNLHSCLYFYIFTFYYRILSPSLFYVLLCGDSQLAFGMQSNATNTEGRISEGEIFPSSWNSFVIYYTSGGTGWPIHKEVIFPSLKPSSDSILRPVSFCFRVNGGERGANEYLWLRQVKCICRGAHLFSFYLHCSGNVQ